MPPKKSKSKAKATPQAQTSSSSKPQGSSLSDPVPAAAFEALKQYHETKALWDAEKEEHWQSIPECRPRDLPREELPVPWFDTELLEQQKVFLTKDSGEERGLEKLVKELKLAEKEEEGKKGEESKKYPIVDEDKLVKKLLGIEGLIVPSGLVEGGKKKRSPD